MKPPSGPPAIDRTHRRPDARPDFETDGPSDAALARALMAGVEAAAREAGALALDYFRLGKGTRAKIWSKLGGSPVTEADLAVDRLLKGRLSKLLPNAGWLSEETVDDPARLARRHVWVVDPIDGTRAFMNGHPDWSVAIALLSGTRPILGLVLAPAHRHLYAAASGAGARRDGQAIGVSPATELVGRRAAGPKPLLDHLERRTGRIERMDKIPSLALRLVRVAEGSVECGLVSSDARDWDIAAADLILAEAGGRLTTFAGALPRYNEAEPLHEELAAAAQQLHPALIEAMRASP